MNEALVREPMTLRQLSESVRIRRIIIYDPSNLPDTLVLNRLGYNTEIYLGDGLVENIDWDNRREREKWLGRIDSHTRILDLRRPRLFSMKNSCGQTVSDFPVITICGSTRFKEDFIQAEAMLSLQGFIVLTCNLFNHADKLNISEDQKQMLDDMHKRKIDMSDFIYVVNRDGYIGESTRSEIDYAVRHGKSVEFMFPGGSV